MFLDQVQKDRISKLIGSNLSEEQINEVADNLADFAFSIIQSKTNQETGQQL